MHTFFRLTRHVLVVTLAAVLLAPRLAQAQCPDGSPPPCAAERRAAARRAPPAPEIRARRFLLLPFRNVSRAEPQAWLESAAPLMLAGVLGQFRELTIVPDERLLAARRRLNIPLDQQPDADQLRRIAEETQGWTAVSGTVIATGGRLRLGAQALDVATGTVLARADTDIAGDGDIQKGFESLAQRILVVTGLPPRALTLDPSGTQSLDAFKAYARGVELIRASAYQRARDALREAVRLDSNFAMAWARLALTGAAWNVAEILNTSGPAYQAVERAAALAPRLPPRDAARVRAMAAFFHGRMGLARALADSLMATDPDDLDALEFGAEMELFDPILDTSVTPPTLRASLNRAVARARDVLERDPGRRQVYGVFGYSYGLAGGLWMGSIPGMRHEGSSFGAMVAAAPDEVFVPVLRDTFLLLNRAAYGALPDSERTAARHRAALAGLEWMQRWLGAAPGDAEAHLWASRLADLAGDAPLALAEHDTAMSLGVESAMDNLGGRHLMLLVRAGRIAEAARIADSLAAAGLLRRPFIPMFDRGYAFGMAALILSRRFALAARVASTAAPPGTLQPCNALLPDYLPGTTTSLPADIAQAMADTIIRHAGAFLGAMPVHLRECLLFAAERPPRDAGAARATTIRLSGIADSLADAHRPTLGFYAGIGATSASRGAVADRMMDKRWFADLAHGHAPGERFAPDSVIVSGDSVVATWRLTAPGPLRWDDPDMGSGYSFVMLLNPPGPGITGGFSAQIQHPWQPKPAIVEGDLAGFAAALTDRRVLPQGDAPALQATATAVSADDAVLRLVIRGSLARELRTLHAEQARFFSTPCASFGGPCPSVDRPITYR